MENWGAITFRENALLLYSGLSSRATMQRVAEVVAHELVHQWFGNLVTMKWWDDLWLNESFATYMAYKSLDNFWPEWNVWTDYLTYAVFGAMSLDGLKSTRAIHAKVLNPDEIDELFDEIAYEKGGSILRMIDEYLEFKKYREGLRLYIHKYQYANAQANDLWESLQLASNKPIKEIMKRFIMQKGFPLVNVKRDKNTILMRQKRFFYLDYKDHNKWIVPLIAKFSGNSYEPLLLNKNHHERRMTKSPFLYLNSDYSSFFITKYDQYHLDLLGKHSKKLNELEIIGLVHDLFSLTVSNQFSVEEALSFIDGFLKEEKRVEVLQYLIGRLAGIYLLTRQDRIKRLIVTFSDIAIIITGLEPKNGEDINVTHLRTISLSSLSSFDEEKIVSFISGKFKTYLQSKKLHPDLRGVIYSGVVWKDDKNFEVIRKLFEESTIQEEKAKLLMALGNSKNPKLVERALNYGLSEKVRFSDFFYLIAATSRNRYGIETNYEWFKKNWNTIKKRVGGHSTVLFRRMLKMIIPTGAIKNVDDAESFLRKHKISGSIR
ncbi:M1 family metallopeptidase [Candidatus Roizmanbacteria bacterium]|nr:M1 family metallopeptidase [Candidatus Roizmanbacteria bacterium]